jgi:dTDP-4-amino-4,6-dideoxygalactose transaminase
MSTISKSKKIPMSSPDIVESDRAAVRAVVETNYLSIGPQIEAFEKEMARFSGVRHGIGVSSGTSGLHLAVIAAGVGEDDIVITTPFSFISSANCVLYERGIPVFVDVNPMTGNIDPVLVEEAVETLISGKPSKSGVRILPPALRDMKIETKRIKAVLPVDAFGQPADMDPIAEVARRYSLAIIEDSCEAIGAEYKGRKAGTLGDVGVYAFYPNKQMTTGEGGMIVTDRAEWDALFRSLRNQGRDEFNAWLNHTRLGYNYRMDEMSAALGVSQLRRIEELLARRERVARWYNERLTKSELVEVPYIAETTTRMSWFVYVVRLNPKFERDSVMRKLAERGIPSRSYFMPIHLQPFYIARFWYRRGDLPVTERLGDVSLALPFSGVMTENQVDYVCRNLLDILKNF